MRIIIFDDSELMISLFSMVCAQLGHDAVGCVSVDALERARDHGAAVVLCDLNIPNTSDPVQTVRDLLPDAKIIAISGRPQSELEQIAAERGLHGAISKDGGIGGVASALPSLLQGLL